MAIHYCYKVHPNLDEVDHKASAQGSDIKNSYPDKETDFSVCIFPDSNSDQHVLIPVMDMVNDIIDDYGDEATPILKDFIKKLQQRLAT